MIGDLINDFRKAMEGKIMENIAIKGHATRGSEVIELLRMLGGVNVDSHKGSFPDEWKSSYYIYGDNTIQFARDEFLLKLNFVIFTLEEFLEKYPYKVGDKVILIDSLCTITKMWWDDINGEILYEVQGKKFVVNCDANSLLPYKEEKTFPPYMDYDITTTKEEEDMKEININRIGFNGDKVRLILPNGYEFKVEGNEVFVIKKKPKYPKTYDKCCDILGVEDRENGYCGYEYELLGKFQKLRLRLLFVIRKRHDLLRLPLPRKTAAAHDGVVAIDAKLRRGILVCKDLGAAAFTGVGKHIFAKRLVLGSRILCHLFLGLCDFRLCRHLLFGICRETVFTYKFLLFRIKTDARAAARTFICSYCHSFHLISHKCPDTAKALLQIIIINIVQEKYRRFNISIHPQAFLLLTFYKVVIQW